MSRTQSRIAWSLVLLLGVGVGVAFTFPFSFGGNAVQDAKTVAPEQLLPAESVVYLGADGRDATRAEFEKTAAYEAIYKSGLADVFGKAVNWGFSKIGKQTGVGGYELFKKTYSTISNKGLSLAVSVSADVGPPKPWAILVLHEAGDLEPQLGGVIKQVAGKQLKFETRMVAGRSVTRADIPARGAPFKLEVGWWKEGKHLVLVGGADAVTAAIDVASGKKPNITTNALWKKYRGGKADFKIATVGWFDLGSLRKMFGRMPVPGTGTRDARKTVNDVLAAVGLTNMNAVVFRSGYRGKATWSDTVLEAPGAKTGLLSLISGKAISLADLPPMPAKTSNFYACSADFSKSYTSILDMVRNGSKLGPPGVDAVVEGVLDQLPAIIGLDPKKDLLDHFGDVVCLYDDPNAGPFGMGLGIVVKVKNAKGLRRTLNDLLERAGTVAPRGQYAVKRAKKHGQEVITAEIGGGLFNPTFVVTEQWMCIGLFPQTVESFLLRVNKKLPTWKPSEEQQRALAEMPKRFSSITVTDPRETYRLLVGVAPALMSFAKFGLKQAGVNLADFPIAVADLPPAELVTNPLFPNVAMRTVDEAGIRWRSRSSLGGFFGADTVAVTAVAAALLLPAVQQARMAARRSSSKNNLKQIGLALHNYHDVYKHFPRGTVENDKLKPEQRLSWIVSVLPQLEQNPLYDRIDQKKGWKDAANSALMKTRLQVLQNPQVDTRKPSAYGSTHYVGIAGLGADSLTAKFHNKKTGIFGYNRVTRIADITDGTSNTMMASEASRNYGPWGSGGTATIRAFTKKPYINGPDGIGGPFPGGCNVLFADGSVRFISKNISAKVLEALATAQGGEVVGDF